MVKTDQFSISSSSQEINKFEFDKDELVIIFTSIETLVDNFSNNKTKRLFDPILSTELAWNLQKLQSKEKLGKKYYVSMIREDPIAPYSRIYRTRFIIYLREEKYILEFLEIDENQIYGNQYNFSDWGIFQTIDVKCSSKQILKLEETKEMKVSFAENKKCKDEILSKDYSTVIINFEYQVKKEKPPEIPTLKTVEERLEELNRIYKKGLISKKEFEIGKKKILNEL
ncbi:MAG: hypothetical protein SFU98_14755 [Leptospiraceae bacterium]|nr:hypothetical protein [Leptospiraceae bacterium]